MHHSTVFNNKLMAAVQVAYICWGLVTQITVLMRWGCTLAVPASAGRLLVQIDPRPVGSETLGTAPDFMFNGISR